MNIHSPVREPAAAIPPPIMPQARSLPMRGGALDALRFVAAFLIVIYHFGAEGPVKLELLHPVFARGYLATDFFLMLSGYVLGRAYGTRILQKRITAGRFLLRRFARIWPAHIIMLAAMVVFVLAATALGVTAHSPSRFAWSDLWPQALLIHAWGPVGSDGWNLPAWSLSALILCYAAFPFLWRGLVRVKPILLPVIGVAAVIGFDLFTRKVFYHPLYDLPFRNGVIRAAPLFLLGACLARTTEALRPPAWLNFGLLLGGLVAVIGLQWAGRFDFESILAIAAIVFGAGGLPARRPSRTIEAAAKLSFALFITHTFIGLLWFTPVHVAIATTPIPLHIQWAMWWTALPLALIAAWAFDRWVDQPVQAWLQPRLGRSATPAATPSGAAFAPARGSFRSPTP